MDPKAFRDYDIRGVVGRDLDEPDYHRLGLAFGTYLARHGDESVVVGGDVRTQSPAFAAALRRGLVETGRRVLDLGLVSTPMTVFALNFLGADGSAMVTASHNPAEYNGLKVRRRRPIHGEQLQELRRLMEAGEFERGEGSEEPFDIREAYITATCGRIAARRSLKVVVDAGNGCGSLVAEDLLTRLRFDVVPLHCEPDGTFPNHHPDPAVPANLTDLQEAVVEHRADIGIALDGDGDRVAAVDEKGRVQFADRLLMILARHGLEAHPGGQVVYDVKCSQGVHDVVKAAGGTPVMVKTGYPHVLARMRDASSVVGGELSGHVYFGGDALFDFDDGLYAAARVLEVLSRDARPVSEQLADFPQAVSTPEIRAAVPEERKFAVTEELAALFRDDADVVELIEIDGARVVYPEGWGLVRASNTQPDLVLVFEAPDEGSLARVKERFAELLGRFPEIDFDLG